MIDYRLITFLKLCETMNYTKTAKLLNLTQPAVTQHIHWIEQQYGVKLFQYSAKMLKLTKQGEFLKKVAAIMEADSSRTEKLIKLIEQKKRVLNFGATLTIGEYTMAPILETYLKENPDADLTMLVDNTEILLSLLKNGKIDFAFIEGHFNKNEYGWGTLSKEPFVAVCSCDNAFAGQTLSLSDLFHERLIVREKGSGTRNILETVLTNNNLSVKSFEQIIQIGNINVIKQLVAQNFGITFIYQKAVQKELQCGSLKTINVADFSAYGEFNFVYLKDSLYKEEYLDFFDYCRKIETNMDC